MLVPNDSGGFTFVLDKKLRYHEAIAVPALAGYPFAPERSLRLIELEQLYGQPEPAG